MKKIILISICFLTSLNLFSQDSTKVYMGLSINYFGYNLISLPSKSRHMPVYFEDVYKGNYAFGWNYRGTKFKYINRAGFNFMFPFLTRRPKAKWYELNCCLGYEWSPKKLKGLYFGGDAFIGRRKYIDSHWTTKWFDTGIQPFLGYKINLAKRFQMRTEVNIPISYSALTIYGPPHTYRKEGFGFGNPLKYLSLEFYWNIVK